MIRDSHHVRITISLPKEQLEAIESIRNTTNRSRFISKLMTGPLQELTGGKQNDSAM